MITEMDDTDEENEELLDSDQQLHEAVSQLSCLPEVEIEPYDSDVHENELVTQFMACGCGCLKWNCFSAFHLRVCEIDER